LPGPIDPNSEDLQNVLHKTPVELEELSIGQSSANILTQAEEVQFLVVTVCLCVCLFVCLYVLCFYVN